MQSCEINKFTILNIVKENYAIIGTLMNEQYFTLFISHIFAEIPRTLKIKYNMNNS